ncbi:olfactory receptor 14C36-like [Chlamydotis macqueenii]
MALSQEATKGPLAQILSRTKNSPILWAELETAASKVPYKSIVRDGVRWVDLGLRPDAHPATISLPLLNSVGAHRVSKPCSHQIQREEGLGCTALAGGRETLWSVEIRQIKVVEKGKRESQLSVCKITPAGQMDTCTEGEKDNRFLNFSKLDSLAKTLSYQQVFQESPNALSATPLPVDTGLALFSLRAAEMLMVSDIQEHSPEQGALLGGRPSNHSSITQFLLLAFADTRELQLLHFWIFLGIYLAALQANGLIITTIACDHCLHTPMYFFLLNLSILDLGFISTTVPKSMANSLWGIRTISYSGCSAQVFFFLFLISAEFYLLTVMAYDRYVAICKPLHYGTLLGSRACVHMAAAAWGSAFLIAVLHTAITFSIPLCQGNAVDQFFCEVPQILKLSCSHSYLGELGLVVFHAFLFWLCFVFIVVSYVQIFRAVLRIPSEQGRQKAFSTCLPHLAVVSLFISTGTFAYLKPSSISSPSLDLVVVAVLYSVVPPAVNPLIYSMRNQELKESIRKVISEMVSTATWRHYPLGNFSLGCLHTLVCSFSSGCSGLFLHMKEVQCQVKENGFTAPGLLGHHFSRLKKHMSLSFSNHDPSRFLEDFLWSHDIS